MHVYKPPPVGGLDRVPVYTAGTGTTRADLFELDGVTPMPGNVLVADTGGNLPSFQCATSPVYVGTSGSRTTWQPNESGTPTAASSAPLPDRWMSRYAGAIDWTTGGVVPWTEVDHSAGSAFGEWSVDGTTFTFSEDVRARVMVQIAVLAGATASGVVGLSWTAGQGTAASKPAWASQVDEGQLFVTVAASTSGHAINHNVEVLPELLWSAGNTITVTSHQFLDAGTVSDNGTDITIFAAGADPNP